MLVADSGDASPMIKQWQEVADEAQLSLAYLGSLSFIVPTFAWGLLKGGEYAVSTAVSAMSSGSGAASTAASVGGQAGMGNFSVGNKGIGNDNFWTQNSNSSRLAQADYQGNFKSALMVEGVTGASAMQQSYFQHFMDRGSNVTKWGAYGGAEGPVLNTMKTEHLVAAGTADAHRSAAELQEFGVDPKIAAYARTLQQDIGYLRTQVGIGGGPGADKVIDGAANLGTTKGAMDQINYHKDNATMNAGLEKGWSWKTMGAYLAMPGIGQLNAADKLSQVDFNRSAMDSYLKASSSNYMKEKYGEQAGKTTRTVYEGDAAGIIDGADTHRVGPDGKPLITKTETGKDSTHYNDTKTEKNGSTTEIGDNLKTQASEARINGKALNEGRFWNYAEEDKNYQAKANAEITAGLELKIKQTLEQKGINTADFSTHLKASPNVGGVGFDAQIGGGELTQSTNASGYNGIRKQVDDLTSKIRNVRPDYVDEAGKTGRLNEGLTGIINNAVKQATENAKVNTDPKKMTKSITD